MQHSTKLVSLVYYFWKIIHVPGEKKSNNTKKYKASLYYPLSLVSCLTYNFPWILYIYHPRNVLIFYIYTYTYVYIYKVFMYVNTYLKYRHKYLLKVYTGNSILHVLLCTLFLFWKVFYISAHRLHHSCYWFCRITFYVYVTIILLIDILVILHLLLLQCCSE